MLALILFVVYIAVVIFISIGVFMNWHKDDYVLSVAKSAPQFLSMVFAISILLWPLTVIYWINLPKEER